MALKRTLRVLTRFPDGFQALKKRRDVIDTEMLHGQLTGVAFLPAVNCKRSLGCRGSSGGYGTQGPLTRHVIDEEAL